MTDILTIRFSCSSERLQAIIARLPSTLDGLPQLPLEIREELVRFAQALQEFITVECDVSVAANTGELIVRLDPSDRLLSLVAALGARDGD